VGKKKAKRKDKKEKTGTKVLAVLRLSTGYEIPFEPYDVKPGGIEHLTKALIGEIVFPAIKEHGHSKALEVLAAEILDSVERLSEKEKTALLGAFIWELVQDKWKQLEELAGKSK